MSETTQSVCVDFVAGYTPGCHVAHLSPPICDLIFQDMDHHTHWQKREQGLGQAGHRALWSSLELRGQRTGFPGGAPKVTQESPLTGASRSADTAAIHVSPCQSCYTATTCAAGSAVFPTISHRILVPSTCEHDPLSANKVLGEETK